MVVYLEWIDHADADENHRRYKGVDFQDFLRVIGMSTAKNQRKPTVNAAQKRRNACIVIVSLIFIGYLSYLLLLNPVFAGLFGLFFALLLIVMAFPRDRPPKDLERLKRDTNRRAHIPPFGAGGGVLFLENGGPTKPPKPDEDH